MRLLNTRTGEFIWVENPHQVRYATLSHVWCKDPRRETSYHDMVHFQEEVRSSRERGEMLLEDAVLSKASYKVRGACALARADGIDWLWVDTCCIDKASSAELEGAINAMYTWYSASTVCYVFLQDVDAHEDPYAPGSGFRRSEWHARGWTLQELIAPQVVLFFSRSWRFIGAKHGMAGLVSDITGVDVEVITGARPVNALSVAGRMSWASRRATTKREDEAYSLMGLFGVHISVVYGEGSMAFLRLQEEILKRVPDESIFVWNRALDVHTAPRSPHSGSVEEMHPALFASSPALFSASAAVVSMSKDQLSEVLGLRIPPSTYIATSHGLRVTLPLLRLAEDVFAAVLACQRNDSLLGLVVKKTSTSDVYSIGVLATSSKLVFDSDDLRCMVQFPIQLDGRLASPTSPELTICVKKINILHPSFVPSPRQLSPRRNIPYIVGLSERSVRCLSSLGHRSSLSTSSGTPTAIALSDFDGTPLAAVELRRCECSGLLESEHNHPCWFAVRLTTASSWTAVVEHLDASCAARGLPECCIPEVGHGWQHLEAFVRSSYEPVSSTCSSSPATPDDFSAPETTATPRGSLSRSTSLFAAKARVRTRTRARAR
ncbi:HET-domain-containing protein [Lentinus brumalis]|uniref:HET-domain-containing protein n=1 Tax=Lentinus brumalis TaxID=2498619 RepID=A0A371DWP7_9APHY|nr:HET-domain-containing protein [Polyporus brumalis]